MARVSPWHAVEGYGRSSRAHTYAHATAHTHIHDERLRYLGALKCTAPSAPARRRIRKQSPHHAPLLRIAAPSCPFLPPPLPSARLSPPRVECLFYLHHTRLIAKAAVVNDAMGIREQVQGLRQRVCAAHAAASGWP